MSAIVLSDDGTMDTAPACAGGQVMTRHTPAPCKRREQRGGEVMKNAKKSPKVHSGLGGTGGPLCSMVPDAALKTALTTLDSAQVTCGNCRKQLGLPKLSLEVK